MSRITTDDLLLILGIFGAIALANEGLKALFRIFSPLNRMRARFFVFMSKHIRVLRFRQNSISYSVEETVNGVGFALKPFLPSSWINRVSIKWVVNESRSYIGDGDLVLRVSPSKSLDDTLMRTLWAYFENSIFPDSHGIFSTKLASSLSMAIARVGILVNRPQLLQQFDRNFVLVSDPKLILEKVG